MKKLKSVLLITCLIFALVGCGANNGNVSVNDANVTNNAEVVAEESATNEEAEEVEEADTEEVTEEEVATEEAIVLDRAGNEVSLVPSEVETVVSLASSTTQVLSDLDMSASIVGVDSYSTTYVTDLSEDVVLFDMMAPDFEALIAMQPDVVFATSMSSAGGEDIFLPVKEAGITVVTIPTPETIEDVKLDVQFIADCVNKTAEGQALVAEMDAVIDEVVAIAETVEEAKKVSYELSPVPYLYGTGADTYTHEMITLIGATNVYEDQSGWISITEEDAVTKNPDVILTVDNFSPDAVGDILARPGWEGVTAVANEDVYYIENAFCTLPNHNIVNGIVQMAKAVYPEAYAGLE